MVWCFFERSREDNMRVICVWLMVIGMFVLGQHAPRHKALSAAAAVNVSASPWLATNGTRFGTPRRHFSARLRNLPRSRLIRQPQSVKETSVFVEVF